MILVECVGIEDEIIVLLQQRKTAAPRDATHAMPFWACAEIAQSTEIAVGAGVDQEDIHLVMGDANGMVSKELGERAAARLVEPGKAF